MRISTLQGSVAPQVSGQSSPPAAMWPGFADSTGYLISWFPPALQTTWGTAQIPDPNAPDFYKVYRDNAVIMMASPPLTNPGVTADPVVPLAQGAGFCPVGWFVDRPGDNLPHNYNVTAVKGGAESAFGPTLTRSTLANGPSATPAAVTPSPDTWIQPFALPTGGTTWTVTQTTVANYNSTGTGALGNVGCGLGFALTNSNQAGGDIIVLTAGLTYQVPASGVSIPPYTGTNGWTYIISSNDPVLNPSASPALPSYALDTTNITCLPVTMTVAPAAGATSCQLAVSQAGLTDSSGRWLKKTGWYYVLFDQGPANRPDERQALFTNGSATVDWSALNALYPSAGLTFACASTVLRTFYTPSVTPFDIAAMPTLSWGTQGNTTCLLMTQTPTTTVNKVRFVGINMQPTPGAPHSLLTIINYNNINFANEGNPPLPTESVYFDRCVFGNDTNSPTWTALGAGFNSANLNHHLVHGCYFWGICRDFSQQAGGGESKNIVANGGNHVWQNTYFQSASQSVIHGGLFMPQGTNFPHDITFRYCLSHKPRSWLIGYNSSTFTGSLSAGTLTVTNYVPTGWDGAAPFGPLQVGTTINWGGTNHTTITGLVSGTGQNGTYTVADTTASVSGVAMTGHLVTNGTPWALFGQGVKNHIEFKGGERAELYGNCFLNCWMGTIQSYHSAALVFTPRSQIGAGTPGFPQGPNAYVAWVHDTDINIHDNAFYYIGSVYYGFGNDTGPTAVTARITLKNNLGLIGSLQNNGFYGERIRIINLEGPMADLVFDHNTFLVNTGDNQGNSGTQLGMAWTEGGPGAGGYLNPSPFTPNGFSRYQDRMTFTNNIWDSGLPSGGVTSNISWSWTLASELPIAGFAFGGYTNLTIGSNLTINDPTVYQGTNKALTTYAPGTFSAVPYASIGFANFQGGSGTNGPYLPPARTSDWSVGSGTYATKSTTGGPVGYIAPGGPNFPLIGAVLVASSVDYSTAPNIAQCNAVVLENFPNFAPGGKTMTQQVTALKALNPAMTVFTYVDIMEIGAANSGVGTTFHTPFVADTNYNWFLWANFTTKGTPVQSQNGEDSVNITSPTLSGPSDTTRANATYRQWWATFHATYFPTNADGIFTDNFQAWPKKDGDYLQNGTTQSRFASAVFTAWQNAYVDWVAQAKAVAGGPRLVIGNNGDWGAAASNGVTITPYANLLDGGCFEGAFGTAFVGAEGAVGWLGVMNNYAVLMQNAKPGGIVFVMHDFAGVNYAALRYSLCSVLLDNGYHYYDAANFGDNSVTASDEYNFKLGAAIAGPGNPTNGTYSNGGIAAAWQNGVWRRDFQNGIVLVNPRGNGAQTVTLTDQFGNPATYFLLRQVVDTDGVNTAQPVTQVTLPDTAPAGTTGIGGGALMLSRTAT